MFFSWLRYVCGVFPSPTSFPLLLVLALVSNLLVNVVVVVDINNNIFAWLVVFLCVGEHRLMKCDGLAFYRLRCTLIFGVWCEVWRTWGGVLRSG